MQTQMDMAESFDVSDLLTQPPPSSTRWAAMLDAEGFLSQARSCNNDAARFLAGMLEG